MRLTLVRTVHDSQRIVMHTIDAVGISRYQTVVDALASDIRAGRLPAGTRLPTHRRLAASEGIAVATASRVYAELEAMGLVSGEQGRGTFVRDITLPPGHGIDQQAAAADTIDLSFNYPALPGQADLLRHALRDLAEVRRSRGSAALPAPSRPPARPGLRRPPSAATRARGRRRPGPDRQRLTARAGHDADGGPADRGRRRGRRPHLPRLQGPRPHAPAGTGAAAARPRADPISMPSSGCVPAGRSAPSTPCPPCTTRSAG